MALALAMAMAMALALAMALAMAMALALAMALAMALALAMAMAKDKKMTDYELIREALMGWVESPIELEDAIAALDRIELESMEERASYEAELSRQQWISVSERLPDAGCEVLWFQPERMNKRRDLGLEERMVVDRCKPTRLSTHWMPLPQPPAGDGE